MSASHKAVKREIKAIHKQILNVARVLSDETCGCKQRKVLHQYLSVLDTQLSTAYARKNKVQLLHRVTDDNHSSINIERFVDNINVRINLSGGHQLIPQSEIQRAVVGALASIIKNYPY